MTTPDTERLRKLAAEATPGPWEAQPDRTDTARIVNGPDGEMLWDARGMLNDADAEFIAAAREHVPALLDMLDQAEAERDQARAQADRVRAVHQPSDPDDPSACPSSCTCGWWAYDECPTVRALDGT